jgi:hypothetical protein
MTCNSLANTDRSKTLFYWLAALFLISSAALHYTDIKVVFPWRFIVIFCIVIPYAYWLTRLLCFIDSCDQQWRKLWILFYLVLGTALVGVYPILLRYPIWPLLFFLFVALTVREYRKIEKRLALSVGASLVILVVGYGGVWNLLSGHFKTGQRWSVQNRPTIQPEIGVVFTSLPPDQASPFWFANSLDRI